MILQTKQVVISFTWEKGTFHGKNGPPPQGDPKLSKIHAGKNQTRKQLTRWAYIICEYILRCIVKTSRSNINWLIHFCHMFGREFQMIFSWQWRYFYCKWNTGPRLASHTSVLSRPRSENNSSSARSHWLAWNRFMGLTDFTFLSGDCWMYPYKRTPMGNSYINPI